MQLLEWQRHLQGVLLNGDFDSEILALLAHPLPQRERRVAIHRNNVRQALLNVLEAAFPVVQQLVGTECFTATMLAFIAKHPPRQPTLYEYGQALPAFLADFPPLAELAWLSDVARLEWARNAALFAAEHTVLSPERLAAIPVTELPNLQLRLHPSAQLLASAWPIHSLWEAHQPEGGALEAIDLQQAERVLIWRQGQRIRQWRLAFGEFALLTAFAAGHFLAEAAEAATQEPGFDLSVALATLLNSAVLILKDGPSR